MSNQMTEKLKSLFDHLNQIRMDKSPDYYDNLTDVEKKGFNQYVILMGLSMDKSCIEEVSLLSKYLNIIPDRQFYKVCCDLIPTTKKFSKWIKNTTDKANSELVEYIAKYFEVGITDAKNYCNRMIETGNENEIVSILEKYGLTEKEIKGLLK